MELLSQNDTLDAHRPFRKSVMRQGPRGFAQKGLKLGKLDLFMDTPFFWSCSSDVHKISARNSGAGNGCTNFMGAWHFLVLSAGKPPTPIKFLLLGRGVGVSEKGGWKCQFYFYGRGLGFRRACKEWKTA